MGDKAGAGAQARKAKQAELDRKMTPKQIRARARRKKARAEAKGLPAPRLSVVETEAMFQKPIEEWDLEELAKGRPKDKNGKFSGAAPKWVTSAMHEKSMDMFKDMVRSDMRSVTVKAVKVLTDLLDSEEEDERGKPYVPASVKADTAKFLIEHLIGKPTQPIQNDISIKLQGILGSVLVQPSAEGYVPSSSHRALDESIIDAEVEEDDEDA